MSLSRFRCRIIACSGGARLRNRVSSLKNDIIRQNSVFATKRIATRIGGLSSGSAIIKIGGFTGCEIEDRLLRLEDSKNSMFAAMESGILPVSSNIFVHFVSYVEDYSFSVSVCEEFEAILSTSHCISEPLFCGCSNGGCDGDVIINSVINSADSFGFSISFLHLENMIVNFCFDTAKVCSSGIRASFESSGSILSGGTMFMRPITKREVSRKITEFYRAS